MVRWPSLSGAQQRLLVAAIETEALRVGWRQYKAARALMKRKLVVDAEPSPDKQLRVEPTPEGQKTYADQAASEADKVVTCRLCDFRGDGSKGLHRHLKATHKLSAADYYLAHLDALRGLVDARVKKVERVEGLGPCWEWQGGRTRRGYGRIRIAGFPTDAVHRISWAASNGRLPKDELVLLHACDTPPCCNPAHLTEGTVLENNQDRYEKGRSARGETHYNAQLTEAQVHDVRWYRSTGMSYPKIADIMGTSASCIDHICNGRSFAHVPHDPVRDDANVIPF